jgi:membrane associated rhomboid family serine protease
MAPKQVPSPSGPHGERAFNAPTALVWLLVLLVAIHAVRTLLLDPFGETDLILLRELAFVPAALGEALGLADRDTIAETLARQPDAVSALRLQLATLLLDGGFRPWTLLTYGLLHAGWEHVIFNSLWMLAFGAPVFRRFGPGRALAFLAACTVAAALLHGLLNPAEVLPVIGASGGVSGLTAAAMRFVLPGGGPLDLAEAHWRPAPPLRVALADGRVLVFLAVWFGINLLAGLGLPLGGEAGQMIAWEAHVGGFLAGLLLFPLFDPRGASA